MFQLEDLENEYVNIENPIFFEIIKPNRNGFKPNFVEKYRENSFNLDLFMTYPIRVYRNIKEYLIPPMKYNLFCKKNCPKCKKFLC